VQMPPDILTELLAGRHFTIEERARLGLLPLEVLRYAEVRRHLAAVICEREWFPCAYTPHEAGEAVDEHIVIERRGAHRFVCHARRAHPTVPAVLAEEVHRRFFSARRAAGFYLKWELHLPGRLDGWEVMP
jgi:hypothetical protein